MKKKILLVVGTLAVFFFGYGVSHFFSESKLTTAYPAEASVQSVQTSFSCSAQVSSSLYAEKIKSRLVGELTESTDKFSVSLDSEAKTLSLLTSTDVEYGSQTPTVFTVIRNDEKALMAVWQNGESDLLTFTLNKSNGFAVYTSSRHSFFASQPMVHSIYFSCI